MKKVKINTEFIKLQQILKLAGVVGQGSDARILIENAQVKVNGNIATQRGKKIHVGDIIQVNDFGEFEVVGD